MAIPDFQSLMLPVLRLFDKGAINIAECLPILQKELGVSDEEAAILNPSGTMTTFANRTHWARTYLSKAGLLSSPARNQHVITEAGRKLLVSGVTKIDLKLLKQISIVNNDAEPVFLDVGAQNKNEASGLPISPDQTPEERMDSDFATVEAALVAELLEALYVMHFAKFEQLILDLLTKMGYGAGNIANSQMTKTSGDGGIDGIINEDKLGLDAVYIQAKRYAPDSKVGRPALQAFVGSLTGEGATKGVFVTTSDFSKEARDYVQKVQHRIVLINGTRLARLMIQNEVGVRARKTYTLRTVDEDYFV